MKLTPHKFFFVMIAILVLVVISGGGVVAFGNILMQKKSKELVDLKLQNRVLEEQQLLLGSAKKDIEKNKDLETLAKTVVPQDKDQARAVREIVQIAKDSGITLKSITFPSSSLGSKATSSNTGTANSSISQATPVEGIPGVYSMQMTLAPDDTVPVTYPQFLDFLSRLETNRRTAQVSQIKIEPKENNITFSLAINIFIKP